MENITELRALANPTRLRILSLLAGGPLSAAEVARRLDIAHGSASFHLRQLAAAGMAALVEERDRRGGRERLYSSTRGSTQDITGADTRPLETAVVSELRRRLALPRGEGSRLVSTVEAWASPADWEQAVKEIGAILQGLADRSSREPVPGAVHASAVALLFPIGPQEP